MVFYFSPLFFTEVSLDTKIQFVAFNNVYILLLVAAKVVMTLFIVLQWVNEYYEIRTDRLIHRRGVIWRKEDVYEFSHIRSVGVHQGIFSKLFNFGTLRLYDWEMEKHVYIYLVHNPMKYHKILETLLPHVDKEKSTIREHLKDEEFEDL